MLFFVLQYPLFRPIYQTLQASFSSKVDGSSQMCYGCNWSMKGYNLGEGVILPQLYMRVILNENAHIDMPK